MPTWDWVGVIIGFACCAVFSYLTWQFTSDFLGQKGTVTDRLIAAGKDSLTIAWSRFTIIVTTGASALAEFATYLGDPEVSDVIRELLQPQYVAVFLIGSAVITEWARRRTL
jgi:hypothetical protein